MKEKIDKWYRQGLWTAEVVRSTMDKGVLPEENAAERLKGGTA